jgi:hypothetical protein
MPLDIPSQAQTGALKFIEGLMGGAAQERGQRVKDAYLKAMYAGKEKPDQMALLQEKQRGRMEVEEFKARNRPPAKPGGGAKGFAPLPVPAAAVQAAAAEARRLAEETDPLRGDEYKTAYNNALRQRLQGLVESTNRTNAARLGRKLLPHEMQDASILAAQVGELVPATPGGFLGFGAKPPVVGPVLENQNSGIPLGADGKPLW